MSRAPNLRGVLWVVVLGWAGASGCIHNHYYGTVPGCPPGTQPVTTQIGSVCDVPSGSTVISGGVTRSISSNVTTPPATQSSGVSMSGQPRVVISQPAYGPPSIGQSSNRLGKWLKPDPENLPTMKAEGGLEDPTVVK